MSTNSMKTVRLDNAIPLPFPGAVVRSAENAMIMCVLPLI